MTRRPNMDIAEDILFCIDKNKKENLTIHDISRRIQRPYATVYWYVRGIGNSGGFLRPVLEETNFGGVNTRKTSGKDSHKPLLRIYKIRKQDDEGKKIDINKFIKQLRFDHEGAEE